MRIALLALCVVRLSACGPRTEKPIEQPPTSPSATPSPAITSGEWGAPNINVCALLAREQVAAIQNTTIANVLSTGRPDGDLLVSQCVYNAEAPSDSVIVSAIERNAQAGPGGGTREFWRKTFDEKEERGKEEEEKEFIPPQKIEGLADEAYWMGGALYSLKNEIILRVSVGGVGDEQSKLQKSRTLSEQALARLFP